MTEHPATFDATNPGHIPVLQHEMIEHLNVRPGGRYVDATFGGGGHSRRILEVSSPDGRLLAMDADPQAVERGATLSAEYGPRFQVQHSNFSAIETVVTSSGFDPVEGVLFDLGLSSFQLDQLDRGFSLHSDARLDMRLDPTDTGATAWDIVNIWDESEIANTIFRYGEERQSRRIAAEIVRRRQEAAIDTNRELAALVERAVGGRRGARIHPATRTFQAIRITVNQELQALERGLAGALNILAHGGRLAVISFHSLEDRIVKQFFQFEARDCVCLPDVPVCRCDHHARVRIITRRPVTPGDDELARNPRSRSAKLRVSELLG